MPRALRQAGLEGRGRHQFRDQLQVHHQAGGGECGDRAPVQRPPGSLATNSIYFCFLFCKKIIDLPGGQINDPSSGETLFSSVPPSNSLVSVTNPWRDFLR